MAPGGRSIPGGTPGLPAGPHPEDRPPGADAPGGPLRGRAVEPAGPGRALLPVAAAGRTARLAREVEALGAHLARFPYLGLDHPVGRRILTAVRRAPKVTLAEALWHRARVPEGPERRSSREMGPPPATWTEGRFNHHGQTVFYLASSAEGACAETAPSRCCILWVQRFRVRGLSGLLDLAGVAEEGEVRRRGVPLLTAGLNAVMERLRPNPASPWKPEYFVPRFVADAARAAGFRGILYCSTRFDGYNAVLFDWTGREIRAEGEPDILEYDGPGSIAPPAGPALLAPRAGRRGKHGLERSSAR